VDQTNDEGFVAELEVNTVAETETCKSCRHTEVVSPITYCIPTDKEVERQQKEWEISMGWVED
jgi:hypothetical protein